MYEDATYEYKLCLFQNITQKKRFNSNEAYLLGVWGGWVGDGHSTMKLKDGTACSSTVDRSTTVEVVRAEAPSPTNDEDGSDNDEPWRSWPVTKITSVSEPTPCEYLVQLEYAFPEDLEGGMGNRNTDESGDGRPNSTTDEKSSTDNSRDGDHHAESPSGPSHEDTIADGEDTIADGGSSAEVAGGNPGGHVDDLGVNPNEPSDTSAEPSKLALTAADDAAAAAAPMMTSEQHTSDRSSSSDRHGGDGDGADDLVSAGGANALASTVQEEDRGASSGDYEYVEGVWVLSESSPGSSEDSSDAIHNTAGDAASGAQVFGDGDDETSRTNKDNTATQNDCATTHDDESVHVKLDAMASELRELKELLKQVVEGHGSKLEDLLKAIELVEL